MALLSAISICAGICFLQLAIAACPPRCVCTEDPTICTECYMWYIYKIENGEGNCDSYIESVHMRAGSNLSVSTLKADAVTINFWRQDLSIDADSVDYYYYIVQSKENGSYAGYQNRGSFVKHYNSGNPTSISVSANNLKPDTVYSLRIALYKRFELKGWERRIDVSSSITARTLRLTWIYNNEYEYMFSSFNPLSEKNFTDASHFCQLEGGHLASITSFEEKEFLVNSMYSYAWIGFHIPDYIVDAKDCAYCDACARATDKATSEYCTYCVSCRAKWRWTDGTDVTYTFWSSDQPSSSYSRCVELYRTREYWDTERCYHTQDFICKREADSHVTTSPEAVSFVTSGEDSNCPVNCLCKDDGFCVGCSMWHVYRVEEENADCEQLIKRIQFPKKPKLLQHNVEKNSIQVKLEMLDLDLPDDALDYYGYSLQYKISSMTDAPFENSGQFIHHYPSEDWLDLMATGLLPSTSYTLRVALYRWFELKGWQELLDVSDTIDVITLDPSWRWYSGNEYMFSGMNNIKPMDYASAESFCRHNGGQLTKVSNVFETDFISNYTGTQSTWIGLHLPDDMDTNGCNTCGSCYSSDNKNTSSYCILCHHCRTKWRWTDGSKVQYTFWNVQEPNQNFRCAFFRNKLWYDAECSMNLYFSCIKGSTETAPVTTSVPDQTGPNSLDNTELAGKIDSVVGIVSGLAVVMMISLLVAVIAFFLILKRNNHPVSTSTGAQPLELGTINPEMEDETRYKATESSTYENHLQLSHQSSGERMDGNQLEAYQTLQPGPVNVPNVYAAVNNL